MAERTAICAHRELRRVLRFAPLAAVEVIQQIVYFGFAVVLAARGWGVLSFGVAAVAQSVIATVALWIVFGRWPGFGFDRAVARRMWGFGLSYQLSFVLYSGSETRWWRCSAASRAVSRGSDSSSSLGGMASSRSASRSIVARVAFPAFSRLQAQPQRLGPIAGASIEAGFLSIAIIQGWLTETAPTLVPIVFSDQWVPAIGVFQLICIGSLAWGLISILRALVYAQGDSRRGLALATFNVGILSISRSLRWSSPSA